ncbi:hypothetical protein [Bacteroides timonensis]|uniref:hypothetical protein n=1 Tax=Bacteroides timonensis TaxID=1470345 RepID=UPI0005C579F2|nr:hypothetical protein [Bacteroides timonensis]
MNREKNNMAEQWYMREDFYPELINRIRMAPEYIKKLQNNGTVFDTKEECILFCNSIRKILRLEELTLPNNNRFFQSIQKQRHSNPLHLRIDLSPEVSYALQIRIENHSHKQQRRTLKIVQGQMDGETQENHLEMIEITLSHS